MTQQTIVPAAAGTYHDQRLVVAWRDDGSPVFAATKDEDGPVEIVTIIPATPGWFVLDLNPESSASPFYEIPIIAWAVTTICARWPCFVATPVCDEGAYDAYPAILRPDGTVFAEGGGWWDDAESWVRDAAEERRRDPEAFRQDGKVEAAAVLRRLVAKYRAKYGEN